ncbi:MAG: hypothetical protein KF805_16955, partial [Phycisphaeraceae bacterium]|nr:hypothetical protein [Phycisphaeraceae bacterium]
MRIPEKGGGGLIQEIRVGTRQGQSIVQAMTSSSFPRGRSAPSLIFRALALCALAAAFLPRAFADTLTWTGAGDGSSFNQAANWSPAKVPASDDDCAIGPGAPAVQVLGNPSVRSLTLARALNITNCWQLTVGVELAL